MKQVGGTVREDQRESLSRIAPAQPTRSALALFGGLATAAFTALILFYGWIYSVHQDLAGSALSGQLSVTLGDEFRHYSIYFPPAEQAWFASAASVAAFTGLRLDLVVVGMTAIAILFSTGVAYRIRRETLGAGPLFLVVPAVILIVAPILFRNVFGLREHMVALGLWPYLVLRISDPQGKIVRWPTRLIVGLWAGATLLFKYLYSIVVLLVELTDAVVQRRPVLLLRMENVAAGAVVALYLILWLGIDPSQRAAIGAVFSAIDANLDDRATNVFKLAVTLAPAIPFLVLLRGFRVPTRIMLLGLAVVVGAAIVSWSQQRWYSHHLFPIVLGYGAWWWMAKRYFPWWGHVVVALCIAYPFVGQIRGSVEPQEQVAELNQAIDAAGVSTVGKRVGVLTMHPSPYNQYLAAHRSKRWNASMNNSYVAAELKPLDVEANAGRLAPPVKFNTPGRRMLHNEMLRLWEDKPPEILILDHSTSWPLRYLDVQWARVFSEDPRFNALLRGYRPAFSHRGKRLNFTYYVRR